MISQSFMFGEVDVYGYLRESQLSACQDECSRFYIEPEIDHGFGTVSLYFDNSNINLSLYLDRFVSVDLGQEIDCIECSAYNVLEIDISNNCQFLVECFQDPCTIYKCDISSDLDCVSNYCGGCYADFYDLDGNMEDCGFINNDNYIEGRWHLVGYEENILYQFENNYRYSIYSLDGTFGGLEDAGNSPNPYIVENDIITIDLFFGNIVNYEMIYKCNGQIVEFRFIDNDFIHSTLFREGYDYENSDCNEEFIDCFDFSNLNFGECDMSLGIGMVDVQCSYVSGCDYVIDDINYFDLFFNSIYECELVCSSINMSCDQISHVYEALHVEQYATCEYDNDCVAVWGHCSVGLGGCYYSVNIDNYPEDEILDYVDSWIDQGCISGICDCLSEPYAQCVNGFCTSSYCFGENPGGCFQTGCEDGYECIVGECTSSFCECSGFYGEWSCTEDCGGGICIESIILGDANEDGELNVVDVVIILDYILSSNYSALGDINSDGQLDVVDIV